MNRRFRLGAKTLWIPAGVRKPLLNRRGRGRCHAMTPEDVHHFRAIGRAAARGCDYFGGFPEVRGAHYPRGYDGELLRILVAEIIEAVHRSLGMLSACPGPTSMGVPSTVQVTTPSMP